MRTNISIAAIRAQYPAPITCAASLHGKVGGREAYCVGGALCLAVLGGQSTRFPVPTYLAKLLAEINPSLGAVPSEAGELAKAIVRANDKSDFEEAWRVAGEALAYGQGGGPQHELEPHV